MLHSQKIVEDGKTEKTEIELSLKGSGRCKKCATRKSTHPVSSYVNQDAFDDGLTESFDILTWNRRF